MKNTFALIIAVFFFTLNNNIDAQWWLNGLQGEYCLDICEHNNKLYVIYTRDNTYGLFSSFAVDQYEGIWSRVPANGAEYASFEFIHSTGTSLFIGGRNGLFKSSNNGETFLRVLNAPVTSICNSASSLFVTVNNQGVSFSDNDGETWTQRNDGLSNLQTRGITSSNQYVFVGTTQSGLYFSENYGISWVLMNAGLPNDVPTYPLYSSIAITFVSTYEKGIFRSNNLSQPWEQVGANYGYWTKLMAVGQSLYLMGDMTYKFSASPDAGNSWVLRTNGLNSSTFVNDGVAFNNFIYIVTSEGIWRALQNELVVTDINEDKTLPTKFSLEQNYPNPFNPETTISYTIAPPNLLKGEDLQHVTLKVYDVLGKEVATLVNEYKQAGNYKVTFNVKTPYMASLPSGIYFYRLVTPKATITKKMVLTK